MSSATTSTFYSVMNEKASTSSSFSPTGAQLLYAIGAILTAVTAFLDYRFNHRLETALILPFAVTAAAVAAIGFVAVPKLGQLKMGQFIREDGPQAHLKKAGTPTMGGVFVVPTGLLIAIIWSRFNLDVVALSLMTASYLAIGGVDDWKSLSNRKNEGLTPKGKLGLQVGAAGLFCLWAYLTKTASITSVALPFGVLPFGLFFWGLAVFVLLAESNATNLTDGVDGLAGGTGAIALLTMAAVTGVKYPQISVFCVCLSGAYLGFLVHNRNKASVFMGDTGSLALGGALAAVGIITNNLWALFVISGIFFIEALSVIAQVSYYKATKDADGKGKRLFRMAPFHHHLELGGWKETQVVGTFYLINLILAVLSWWSRPIA
jgi:phospho-N-acetylmuramoyl-pentapeptide-transferase